MLSLFIFLNLITFCEDLNSQDDQADQDDRQQNSAFGLFSNAELDETISGTIYIASQSISVSPVRRAESQALEKGHV